MIGEINLLVTVECTVSREYKMEVHIFQGEHRFLEQEHQDQEYQVCLCKQLPACNDTSPSYSFESWPLHGFLLTHCNTQQMAPAVHLCNMHRTLILNIIVTLFHMQKPPLDHPASERPLPPLKAPSSSIQSSPFLP